MRGARAQKVQRFRNQLFSTAGLSLDQNGKWRIGELRDLLTQLVDWGGFPDTPAVGSRTEFRIADLECALKEVLERLRLGGLGDKLDCPERARVPCVGFIALPPKQPKLVARGVGAEPRG